MELLIVASGQQVLCNSVTAKRSITAKTILVMKLTVFILLVFCLHVNAIGIAQNITLKLKDASLREAFASIKRQSGYTFFFDPSILEKSNKITVDIKNVPLKEALDKCFRDQPFTYFIEGKIITIEPPAPTAITDGLSHQLLSPSLTAPPVTGVVRGIDGQPIGGANILIKGTTRGTISSADGTFIINASLGDVLIVSSINYATKALIIDNNFDVGIVSLKLSTENMDEVQIIAYGTIFKKLNTGNVGTVKSSQIEKQNNNPVLALAGRVAGVEINQVNGVPGGAVKINIRGVNTLRQGTDPLVVIDGVPYNSNLFNTSGFGGLSNITGTGGGGSNQNLGLNPLSLINSQDIESIEILKDADATAIYGSRGANGVILITTKKGKEGPASIDLNLRSGIGNITRKAELMNTQQYLAMRREAFLNDNVTPTIDNAKDLLSWDQNAYTDWQEMMIGGTSKYTDAQGSVSGGTASSNYLMGVNYHKETSVFPGDWSNVKMGAHFNIDASSANNKFNAGFSGSFMSDNNKLPNQDFSQFILFAPNAPSLTSADGSLNWKDFPTNPYRFKILDYNSKTNNLLGQLSLSYKILPDLEIKSSLGYNNILLSEVQREPIAANDPSNNVKTGLSSFNRNVLTSYIVEPQINYKKNFGQNKLSVLVGGTMQRRFIDGQVVIGDGYTDDGLLNSLAGAATVFQGTSVFETYRYASVFARINYNFDDKYLLNLTGRRDGSSRFGPGRQFGNFGAIGAAWLFSEEKFMKLQRLISFGKVRGSYGTVGNEPSTNYDYLELYDFTNNQPYGGGIGIYPNNIYAPDYRWELNRKLELGLELGVFQNRINLTASYYRNRSSNQLVQQPLPPAAGRFSIIANLPATVQNSGWELTITSDNYRNVKFSWSSSLNFSLSENKLVSFPNFENSVYINTFTLGQPVNIKRVFKSAGIDPLTGMYLFYDKSGKTTPTPANPTDLVGYVDINPKFFGGLQNTLRYKGLSLDFAFQFVKTKGKNYLFAGSANPGWLSYGGAGNAPLPLIDRWNNENTGSNFQRYSQDFSVLDRYYNAQVSDLAYSDASFVRLKTAAFSFQFPERAVRVLHLRALRLYLQGQNLLTFTGYKGADPETQNISVLPPLRIITTGIQITL
jgi:TonB-linked SusC/RagA family outer membrane protein